MKPQEIRDLSLDQIDDHLRQLAKRAMNMRFEQAMGQIKNTAEMRNVRRDRARLKTERRKRLLKDAEVSRDA